MAKTIRRWQMEALAEAARLYSENETEMSVEAGVGSGKTLFATHAVLAFQGLKGKSFIIVVTINRRCQRQWSKTMKEHGVVLRQVSGNSSLSKGLPPDVQGYICTYASMGRFPDLHAAFCGARPTYVIFDEVHHLNEDDNTTWGKAAIEAFSSAVFRLSLSGTYFSSNGAPIPFTRMKPIQGSNSRFINDPHCKYLYGEAVADRICRRIDFKPFNGLIEYRREGDKEFKAARFEDDIQPEDEGNRLWAACQTKGVNGQPNVMLEEMLFGANRRLMDLRVAGHADAGGLIVCGDVGSARQTRMLIERISGHRAVLVLNDEEGSDKALDAFANGTAPWLVAVKMVTEGVDIPRLRIGVYLGQATKRLTFVQFLGRMVRHFRGDPDAMPPVSPHPAGEAYCYYPQDKRLHEIAQAIEAEVKAAFKLRESQGGGECGEGVERRRYQSGAVDGEEQDNVIAGDNYSAREIEVSDQLRLQWPNLREQQLIDMVKFVREAAKQPTKAPSPPPPIDNHEDHDTLRNDCARLAQRLAKIAKVDFNAAHIEGNKAAGIRNIETATIAQFKIKKVWLEEQIAIALDPTKNGYAQTMRDIFE